MTAPDLEPEPVPPVDRCACGEPITKVTAEHYLTCGEDPAALAWAAAHDDDEDWPR
jgi:hypothetical protein